LSVTVGVEDTRISYGRAGFGNATNNGGIDDGASFYAGLNYSGNFGTFAFTAAHDTLAVDYDDAAELGALHGWYANDGDYDTDYVHSNLLTLNPEAIWGIAFNANLSDEIEFYALYSEVEGTEVDAAAAAAAGLAGPLATTGDAQLVTVGLNWYPAAAPGFHIKSSYSFGEVEDNISPVIAEANGNADFDGFELTLRRDF